MRERKTGGEEAWGAEGGREREGGEGRGERGGGAGREGGERELYVNFSFSVGQGPQGSRGLSGAPGRPGQKVSKHLRSNNF